ncbi:MAG: alpha/beta hydrolase [Bacteroidota bacterium]|nr:alpha/beta hydrolase [Bacteroidota bacterium]
MQQIKGYNIKTAAKALKEAKTAMIMIHGRGGTAENILSLTEKFEHPEIHFIAPQAPGNTWYPNSFLAPILQNEPGITSGIQIIQNLAAYLEEHGIKHDKIFFLGFSQGACLALEFAARNAKKWGGIFGLSGGLIGPENTPRNYPGTLEGTPVFLGCSDEDPHIPLQRVHESKKVFEKMQAKVTERIYPGMPHTIIQDEIDFVKDVLSLDF